MHKRKLLRRCALFFMLLATLFLVGCEILNGSTPENVNEKEHKPAAIDLPKEDFQKIIGWITNEEILVHHGNMDSHKLVSFNIYTGQIDSIIEEEMFFLTIEICPNKRYIFVQQVSEEGVYLSVFDREGYIISQTSFHSTNYVTINWNPADSNELFLSYYMMEENGNKEEIVVEKWNLSTNEREKREINSLHPKWYSRNLFLYVDEGSEELYIGDIRTNDDHTLISRDVTDFFLYEDTFISLVPSDINEKEIYLFHEFPFMVYTGAIALPKVITGDRIVAPYLSQSKRNGDIYAVVPDEFVELDYDLGSYNLTKLDFSEGEKEIILRLPENAPIKVSPDEKNLLYGWQLEHLIMLDDKDPIAHNLVEES